MIKKTIISCLIFTLFLSPAWSQRKDTISVADQQTLKDLFLCYCIFEGFKDDSLLYKDHSIGLYFESITLNEEMIVTWDSVKALAQRTGSAIPVSNLTGKKGVLIICMERYKSRELELAINRFYKKD